MLRRPLALTAVAAALLALAGCGLQPGKASSGVSVTVTRDFGSRPIGRGSEKAPGPSQTVMGLTRRFFSVSTRFGGGIVAAIDGSQESANRTNWFYYVNGVQSGISAAARALHNGDRVWWDLHDSTVTADIPAVVGSFPEPFVHGYGGQRYPTTLECAADVQASCTRIGAQLRGDGVPVADQALGTGSGSDTLNIVVATWSDLRGSIAGEIISGGPRDSGIYATFVDAGHRLELLNPAGKVVQTLGAGGGLVAATHDQVSQPEWLITGTDAAGVRAAAAAVTPQSLHDRFALAVDGGRRLPLPLQPGL